MENKFAQYGMLAAVVFVLAISIYLIATQSMYITGQYQRAVSAENPSDICATPAGYTDQQWREHMGHHPDRYAQCLQT